MKKLKNKIFLVLFSMLSIFVLIILITYNAILYINELNNFIAQFETMRKMMKGLGGLKNSLKGKKGKMPFMPPKFPF